MTNSNLTLDLFYSKDNEVKRRTDSYLIKEFNDRTIRVYSIIPRLPTMLFKIEQILTKTVIFWEQQALISGIKQISLEATLNAAPFYRKCGFIGDTVSQYQSPRGFQLDCIPMINIIQKKPADLPALH